MEYLGTIGTTQGATVNNRTTVSPFRISDRYRSLIIVTPATAGVTYRVRIGFGENLRATNNDFAIGPSRTIQIACPNDSNPDTRTVIAIRSTGGAGNVEVYGAYGEAVLS